MGLNKGIAKIVFGVAITALADIASAIIDPTAALEGVSDPSSMTLRLVSLANQLNELVSGMLLLAAIAGLVCLVAGVIEIHNVLKCPSSSGEVSRSEKDSAKSNEKCFLAEDTTRQEKISLEKPQKGVFESVAQGLKR